jgi:hypothetical protein
MKFEKKKTHRAVKKAAVIAVFADVEGGGGDAANSNNNRKYLSAILVAWLEIYFGEEKLLRSKE